MNEIQIWKIIEDKAFPDLPEKAELIETHISWVILTTNFAFKIKKPMHYTFLDFSTIEKRKYYCEKEVELNRRLTDGMYLGVVPVFESGGKIIIENGTGNVIGFAVKMTRMDNSRQMNLLLEKGKVTARHMDQLAEQLADFHVHAETVKTAPDMAVMQTDFADILNVKEFLGQEIGEMASRKIKAAVELSAQFLQTYAYRFEERHRQGFMIDGHGDLHSKNILLLQPPVIFDCIEFSSHFRRGDVLNELAFFCMDLDAYGQGHLEKVFLEKYLPRNACLLNEADENIFQYFKLYRANVRLKVNALKAKQSNEKQEFEIRMALVKKYLDLMEKYQLDLAVKLFAEG